MVAVAHTVVNIVNSWRTALRRQMVHTISLLPVVARNIAVAGIVAHTDNIVGH